LHVINLYSACSGLRANFDKTQAIWIGARRGCGMELHTYPNIIWNHSGSFKMLGIQYCLLKEDKYKDNYISKIDQIKRFLNDWPLRKISL
jgi:hypothetical protein